MILIIELLLKKSANIYDVDNFGRSAMHYANRRNAQDILIKHAKELEEKGLDGAVQALLRMRNHSGETPLDFMKDAQDILIKTAKELEEKGLDGAVQARLSMGDYSGTTLLEFMNIICPDDMLYLESQLEEATARNGRVMYDFVGSDTANLDGTHEEAAGYKEWIQSRRQQLENDYKAVIRMNVQRDA